MSEPACPLCGAPIEVPTGTAESLEENVDCPGCGRPLTWFVDDQATGRWIVDEAVEGRRRMTEGPGDGVGVHSLGG
jgi:endogenous inhibitor of DNA gyrase (YacG/DUF329 family)